MPRKMSGRAMRTMEASIVAISMPRVVMKSAAHLCPSLARTGRTAARAAVASATWVIVVLRSVGPRRSVSVVTSLPPRPTFEEWTIPFC